MKVELRVNGQNRLADVEPRKTLLDTLRENLLLNGVHAGCEHGVCGACTVLVDGEAVRSCLMFAVQADGYDITTIEGLAPAPGVRKGLGGMRRRMSLRWSVSSWNAP